MVIEINKDIDRYQESVAMGLTAKQLIFSIASVVIGGGLVYLLYPFIGLTGAAYVAIPVVAPIALGGFYSYNGMSFYEVMGKKFHYMFGNRALTYVSTEGEPAIKASDIIKQQRVRNKNNDFSSEISYAKRTEKKEIEAIMDDVRENDQCLFYVGVTIILMADSKKELESITETVETIGKRNSCTIDVHYLKQREALNTALPIGVRQVETMRTMLTQSLAVLMPFNVQELNDEGGVYYGINQVSKNINIGNRKKLINGNGFVFGVPGSGKSFFCKAAMGQVFLSTDDEIIIIDPMNGATRWQLKRLSTYASLLNKNI